MAFDNHFTPGGRELVYQTIRKENKKVFNAEKVCTLLRKMRELCIFATFYTLLTLLFSRHYCKELT